MAIMCISTPQMGKIATNGYMTQCATPNSREA
nr:MAG TPA: hypothetical protein [Caudoviricetes sp.]